MCKSISPLKGAGDFDDGEFCGFCGDFEQHDERIQNHLKIEMECHMESLDMYDEDTEDLQEAQVRYGQLKQDLERQIALCIGSEG